jgi:hypothetical protein
MIEVLGWLLIRLEPSLYWQRMLYYLVAQTWHLCVLPRETIRELLYQPYHMILLLHDKYIFMFVGRCMTPFLRLTSSNSSTDENPYPSFPTSSKSLINSPVSLLLAQYSLMHRCSQATSFSLLIIVTLYANQSIYRCWLHIYWYKTIVPHTDKVEVRQVPSGQTLHLSIL